jgi:hypothetical protein
MGRNESPGTKEPAKSRMTPFMPIIHVVDDDESFRVALARRLLRAAVYEVHTYSSAGDFLLVRGKWDAPHWASCSEALRTGTAAAKAANGWPPAARRRQPACAGRRCWESGTLVAARGPRPAQ